jgi:hypothetical protein
MLPDGQDNCHIYEVPSKLTDFPAFLLTWFIRAAFTAVCVRVIMKTVVTELTGLALGETGQM